MSITSGYLWMCIVMYVLMEVGGFSLRNTNYNLWVLVTIGVGGRLVVIDKGYTTFGPQRPLPG